VAIIIPYRNRHEHLKHLLFYLHPMLVRQQLDYGIYVINQDGEGVFNRAKLMNVGFAEAAKEYDYECFIFSDVDLVPMDDRNLYRCFEGPRHLSVAIDKFDFKLPYSTIFGGVSSFSKQQFLTVNGYPNTYWGWGGEDDDMYKRIVFHGMSINRPDHMKGRYKMIKHQRDEHNEVNPKNPDKLSHTHETMDKDGDGGRYMPRDCLSQHKVAIIIPYRNRHEHLKHLLFYLHPMLVRQQLDYGIYVINQDGEGVFNRAKLMNVGFAEAAKEYDYECFIFSDVDLVPMDDRNLYRCFEGPRHLSVAIDKFNFKLPYSSYFGGVSALTKEQFLTINGFPNTYWGWGGEDDDIYQRIIFHGMSIFRPDHITGKYKMIQHQRDKHNEVNPKNSEKLTQTHLSMDKDGIKNLNYTVKEIAKDRLYTFINVDIHAPVS
ncbi:unnamed protein product, partial [Tetraodon nigroviridis]